MTARRAGLLLLAAIGAGFTAAHVINLGTHVLNWIRDYDDNQQR